MDGGQHSNQVEADENRTAWLEKRGYKIVRFWNNEVLDNIEGVLTRIEEHLEDPPHLNHLPPPYLRQSELRCGRQGGRGLQRSF